MSSPTDMVAGLFGPDQLKIAEWVITVPSGMDPDDIVQQVLVMAAHDETLRLPEGGMVYVALRPADDDDRAQILPRPNRTIH